MKKYLFILAAMLFCVTSNVNAGDKIVFTKPAAPLTKPKSPQLNPVIITGEYDEESLTIYFANYDGNALISIVNVTTNQVVSVDNETVTSPDVVNIDLSGLTSSTYYIYIELDNGDSYYATIQI